MKRAGGQQQAGYTIVEVMIFLTVTAVLFASAISIFNGQQERTNFTQGVRELDSSISDALNEVTSGFYPKTTSFTCSANGDNGKPAIRTEANANSQGTSLNCIFVGKVIQFAPRQLNGDDCRNCHNIYTIAGRRQVKTASDLSKRNITTLEEAFPIVVAPNSTNQDRPDFTAYKTTSPSVWIEQVYAKRANRPETEPPVKVGGFGFISTFANSVSELGDRVGGAQSVSLLPIYGSDVITNTNAFAAQTEGMKEEDRNPSYVIICLRHGGNGSNDRYASITIGGTTNDSQRKFSTDVAIDSVPEVCKQ